MDIIKTAMTQGFVTDAIANALKKKIGNTPMRYAAAATIGDTYAKNKKNAMSLIGAFKKQVS